jgi:hypothetical protein
MGQVFDVPRLRAGERRIRHFLIFINFVALRLTQRGLRIICKEAEKIRGRSRSKSPAIGSYKLEASVGEVKIAVDNRMLNQGGRKRPPVDLSAVKRERPDRPGGGDQVITGSFVPLPSHYGDPEAQGLKYTVKNGLQTHDIELSGNPNRPPPPGS